MKGIFHIRKLCDASKPAKITQTKTVSETTFSISTLRDHKIQPNAARWPLKQEREIMIGLRSDLILKSIFLRT